MKSSALITLLLFLSLSFIWAQETEITEPPASQEDGTVEAEPADNLNNSDEETNVESISAKPVSETPEGQKALLQEYFKADGLGQWQHNFDISGLDKGTYNLVVRGIDSAGNEIEANAIDISIDPRSDLPTASISFPTRGSVVTGNVTILGSGVDDDSIQYVEVKLDDGAYSRAEGQEYWTAELVTGILEDGEYTITARATDIYGTTGDERSLSFHYNRKAPVITVESVQNGDLVSGKLDISGTISDPNGISQLFYSLDEGETFEAVSLKGKLKEGTGEFSFNVDTRKLKLPDGPQIIILKGTDMRGGEGSAAFLVYIDNSDPVLDFIFPAEDSIPNGKFTIIGRAFDEVGVESLSYSYKGGEQTPIPLQPGNPFWSIEADFRNEKSAVLEFSITDTAGNTKNITYKRDLDIASDLPTVQLLTPSSEEPMLNKRLQGWVIDDDAPKGIVYSIDKSEEQRVDTGRSFDIDVSSLSAGQHVLNIRGIDVYDVEGEEQVVKFDVAPEKPQVTNLFFVKTDGSTTPYSLGIEVDPEYVTAIGGSIQFAGGGGTAICSLPGGEEIELDLKKGSQDGEFVFELELPENTPYGYVPFNIKASDELGSTLDYTAWFWMTNLVANQQEHGFYLPYDTAILRRGEQFTLRYVGYPLDSVEFDPPVEFADISNRNGVVTVTGTGPGMVSDVRIKGLSNRETEFVSGPITIISDTEDPELSFDGGHSDTSVMVSSRHQISGTVSDDAGPLTLVYTLAGAEGVSEERKVSVSGDISEGTFSININPSDLSLTGSMLTVTARDGVGNTVSLSAALLPEQGPEPAVKLYPIAPTADVVVLPESVQNGKILVAAGFSGVDSVQNAAVSIDGGEPVTLTGFPVAVAEVPLPEAGSHSFKFSAETAEGKKLSGSGKCVIAGSPGKINNLQIGSAFVQGSDYARTEDLSFTGDLEGLIGYETSEYVIDSNETESLKLSKGDNGYSFSIPIAKLSFGSHKINLKLVDEFGRSIEKEYLFYLTAGSEGRNIEDEEGIYQLHSPKESYIIEDNLKYFFNGRKIDSIAFLHAEGEESSPAEDILNISFSNSIISLERTGSGRAEQISFELITIDGDKFSFGPFDVSTDASPPVLTTESFDTNIYFPSSIPLKGTLEDDLLLNNLEYSLNGSAYSALELRPYSGETDTADTEAVDESVENTEAASFDSETLWTFQTEVPLNSASDGPLTLRLKALDVSGNEQIYEYFLIKDTAAPKISQVLPEAAEPVNGAVSLFVNISDEWAEHFKGTYLLQDLMDEPVTEPETETETEAEADTTPIEITADLESDIPALEIPTDLSVFETLPENINVSLSDNAGNIGELSPVFAFDALADLPRVQIQIPIENAVIQETTRVSGTTSDDDGIAKIEYSIDDGEFIELPAGSSFEFDLEITQLSDNEHFATVRAFDINGVESEHVILNFRVSRELPVAQLVSPKLGTTNKGIVTLEGTASDENGIEAIYLSVDNGNSFQKVIGTTEWSYDLDSQVLIDGNYMVLIRAVDGYGITALYSSLLTLDNTAPKVELALPMDGESFTKDMPVQLRVTDELVVRRVEYSIEPLDVEYAEGEEPILLTGAFEADGEVLLESLDINELVPGRYSFSLFAYDDADNEVVVTRNIVKKVPNLRSVPKLLFPLAGSSVSGAFYIEGRIEGDHIPETVTIRLDENDFDVVEVSESGYFYREVLPEELTDGAHIFQAVIRDDGSEELTGALHDLEYSKTGPWVQFNTVHLGSFVRARPYIEGHAGYALGSEVNLDDLPKAERKGYKIAEVEYSLDNGQNFLPMKAEKDWRFRLETQELSEGDLAVLVRATFANGEIAQARTLVIVDDTSPRITLVTPEEGKAFNDIISVSGTAFDENGISDISVMLRKGSKNNYGVPQFIQGLYIDVHGGGASYFESGVGLTFFDDNVKIQLMAGIAPEGRFNGNVFGLKLLANVATIPYGYFFGPDWEWLSSSVAVGSAFEYFTMTESQKVENEESKGGLVLGAIVGQVEIAKAVLPNLKFFNTFSLYYESQLWFISSDVEGGLIHRPSVGIRVGVF